MDATAVKGAAQPRLQLVDGRVEGRVLISRDGLGAYGRPTRTQGHLDLRCGAVLTRVLLVGHFDFDPAYFLT